jgi:hypothetical protein
MGRLAKSAKTTGTTGNSGWKIQPFGPTRVTKVSEALEVRLTQHYCRGCGKPLPHGSHGLFHPDCLKADKRRRIWEKRRREQERIWKWLRKNGCAGCQANFRSQERISREPSEQSLCEVSQGPQSHEKVSGQGLPLETSASQKVSTSAARIA